MTSKNTDMVKSLLPWASVIMAIIGVVVWSSQSHSQIIHNKDAVVKIEEKVDELIKSESDYQMEITDRLARIETKIDGLDD